MKLYMKQRVITWRDHFSIYDEKHKEKYHIQGELISIGKKLHVFNENGEEIGKIKEKLLKILDTYEIQLHEQETYELKQKITLVSSKYRLEPLDWVIDGGILEHNYDIKQGRKVVASVHQKWVSWGDTYCIEIADGVDPALVVSVIVAIDCIEAERKEKKEKKEKREEEK